MIENTGASFRVVENVPQQFVYRAGPYIPLGFYPEHIIDAREINPNAPIGVREGQTIEVNFLFEYSGKAREIVFVIGNCHKVPTGIPPYVYDIGDSAEVTVRVDASTEPVTYPGSGTFIFYAGVHTKPHLFINPQDVSPESDTVYTNAFTKVEDGNGEYKLVRDYTYPRASTYNGPAELCNFTFKLLPEQIPGADWISQKIIDVFASEMSKGGREMLTIKVWEDTTPTLWTSYVIEIVYTDPGAATASLQYRALIAHIGVIIAAVVALAIIAGLTFLIREIRKLWWGEEGVPGLGNMLEMVLMLVVMMIMMSMITPMMTTATAEPPKELPREEY